MPTRPPYPNPPPRPKRDSDFMEKKPQKRKPRPKPANPNAFSPQGRAGTPSVGIMGSTPNKKDDVKKRMLDDMRKRGMLNKTRKKAM